MCSCRWHPTSASYASPEGEDGDAIWLASVSPVQTSLLKDGHKDSSDQGLVDDIIKSSVVRQGTRAPVVVQAMVAHSIRHGPTVAVVGLLDTCTQPQGNVDEDRIIMQKEPKDLYRDS